MIPTLQNLQQIICHWHKFQKMLKVSVLKSYSYICIASYQMKKSIFYYQNQNEKSTSWKHQKPWENEMICFGKTNQCANSLSALIPTAAIDNFTHGIQYPLLLHPLPRQYQLYFSTAIIHTKVVQILSETNFSHCSHCSLRPEFYFYFSCSYTDRFQEIQ